jgi:hypothetical protein
MWKDGDENVDLRKDGLTVRQDMMEMDESDEITTEK